ncbi:hypothetical protein E0H50_13530 [Kribbella sindirgiensis]|uniref:Uncharacterized protein n=1 Tax=Kribbella sindirgiensis TaxID=1124744 RepID=A0A4R0ITZ6_9ACTN|nr:hypothetical protein E0H50_13530 [Kribbella sindirgiensis]
MRRARRLAACNFWHTRGTDLRIAGTAEGRRTVALPRGSSTPGGASRRRLPGARPEVRTKVRWDSHVRRPHGGRSTGDLAPDHLQRLHDALVQQPPAHHRK